ncbi:hypothetical protein [Cereibacter sphaeroides]|uniref:hypothetical protein n=1 Tax=Cereibacter sphaeroides TaxID=1063 RepID=UPI0013569C04
MIVKASHSPRQAAADFELWSEKTCPEPAMLSELASQKCPFGERSDHKRLFLRRDHEQSAGPEASQGVPPEASPVEFWQDQAAALERSLVNGPPELFRSEGLHP